MTLIQLALALVSLAVIVTLMATINSLVLQAVFTLTRLRGWVQRRFVRRWITDRMTALLRKESQYMWVYTVKIVDTVESTLARLSGRGTGAYAYDAPYAQICAQISNASRAAIEALTSATAKEALNHEDGSSPENSVRAQRELLHVLGATATAADIDRLSAPVQRDFEDHKLAESASRVLYHVERGIDSLQAALATWWARAVYVFSFIVSLVLLGVVAADASALRIARQLTADRSAYLSTPWVLLVVIVALSALVTPHTMRLFDRARRGP